MIRIIKSILEEMGGTYTLGADGMYYPNLELPKDDEPRYGKYGRMRRTYLREHKKAYYTTLLFDNTSVAHLNEMDDAAQSRKELAAALEGNRTGHHRGPQGQGADGLGRNHGYNP